jgi:hypothetical protein
VANSCTPPLHPAGVLHLLVFWSFDHGEICFIASHPQSAFCFKASQALAFGENTARNLSLSKEDQGGWERKAVKITAQARLVLALESFREHTEYLRGDEKIRRRL